jgi:probable HAF family extracellular repeat protein
MKRSMLGVVVVGSVASFSAAQEAAFCGVGDLPGGAVESRVWGVSADGRVVVGRSKSSAGPLGEAFRWTMDGGIVALEPAPGGVRFGEATAASADGGVIVGQMYVGKSFRAVRWVDGEIELLGDLGDESRYGRAQGVSADGGVVVGLSFSPLGTEGFRWTAATGMVGLGDLPGGAFGSEARGVSPDGSIIVGDSRSHLGDSQGRHEAMRWSAATGMIALGDIGGSDGWFGSSAAAISADGLTVVGHGREFGAVVVARWTASRGIHMIWPGIPFVWSTMRSYAVSGDGTVVVGGGWTDRRDYAAFVWSPYADRMRELRQVMLTNFGLDPKGWTLTEATGVSADGTDIVGNGINPMGYPEGWVVYLPQVCRADVNRDTRVDGADVMAFVEAFVDGDAVDFNGDLVVDTGDFFAFLRVFFGECE